ncbi:MAG: hypothetical protein WBD25_03760 [Terriglobales bacterium]|jgi:hypothetical protein
MSDETMNHGNSGHDTEFEHEDLSSRGLFAFMIGLAVSGVVIYFIIVGMYSFLDRYERSQMATASPLVTTQGAMSRVVTQEDMDKTFKDNGAPMLETDERSQFRGFLIDQEDQLNSYGWVDEKAGVAHIPIERAMELIVKQNLPVYPQSNTDAASKVPAQESAAKQ